MSKVSIDEEDCSDGSGSEMSKVSIDEEDCSDGSGSDENSGEEEETSTDSNPLNYKRFAKETIHSIHQETKFFITCIAVHEKVCYVCCDTSPHSLCFHRIIFTTCMATGASINGFFTYVDGSIALFTL